MTRNQIDVLLVGLCLVAEAAIVFGLTALGVGHGPIILAVLVLMMVTCWMVGETGSFPVEGKKSKQR
jgi:hypothetical protein